MRASRMLCIAVALIAAASVTSAVTWVGPAWVSDGEPEPYDGNFQVPLNNAWGAQSYDYLHDWFSAANEERVHVAYWFKVDSTYFEVRYALSEDRGESWQGQVYISDSEDTDQAWTPSIATYGPHTDTHDVNITYYDEWYDASDQRYSILHSRSDDQGATWPDEGSAVTPNS